MGFVCDRAGRSEQEFAGGQSLWLLCDFDDANLCAADAKPPNLPPVGFLGTGPGPVYVVMEQFPAHRRACGPRDPRAVAGTLLRRGGLDRWAVVVKGVILRIEFRQILFWFYFQ